MRDRLEHEPAILAISAEQSSGAVTAERRASGGWPPGLAELVIEHGELVVSVDSDGAVLVDELALAIAPIDVPETVLGYGVQLTDIRLELESPARVVVDWDGADESSGTADVQLALSWSLTNHGDTSPLGSPELPLLPVELVLTGNADVVHAELRVTAFGELWRWADLVRFSDLNLVLAASSH